MKTRYIITAVAVIAAVATFSPDIALAAGGGGLPWDAPLTTLKDDLTGTTAFSIAMIAAFAAIIALAFGGEMAGWVRAALIVTIAMAFLCAIPEFAAAVGINVGGMVAF